MQQRDGLPVVGACTSSSTNPYVAIPSTATLSKTVLSSFKVETSV